MISEIGHRYVAIQFSPESWELEIFGAIVFGQFFARSLIVHRKLTDFFATADILILAFWRQDDLFFIFFFQNLQFEFIKEEIGYGTIDLLCDIGGTLSLLMGASVLTCCELLEVAWFTLVQMCCRKSKEVRKARKASKRAKKLKKEARKKKVIADRELSASVDFV